MIIPFDKLYEKTQAGLTLNEKGSGIVHESTQKYRSLLYPLRNNSVRDRCVLQPIKNDEKGKEYSGFETKWIGENRLKMRRLPLQIK